MAVRIKSIGRTEIKKQNNNNGTARRHCLTKPKKREQNKLDRSETNFDVDEGIHIKSSKASRSGHAMLTVFFL